VQLPTPARPSVVVALLTPFAEVSALRAELSRGPALVGVKRALSERLTADGVRYIAAVRPQLG
jgi:hypothetical protein